MPVSMINFMQQQNHLLALLSASELLQGDNLISAGLVSVSSGNFILFYLPYIAIDLSVLW